MLLFSRILLAFGLATLLTTGPSFAQTSMPLPSTPQLPMPNGSMIPKAAVPGATAAPKKKNPTKKCKYQPKGCHKNQVKASPKPPR